MQHDAYMDGYHDGDMNDMGGGMGGMDDMGGGDMGGGDFWSKSVASLTWWPVHMFITDAFSEHATLLAISYYATCPAIVDSVDGR